MSPEKTCPKILTIAGSDSGGGAGIQADLKTFTLLKCHGMSVVTALTAQNTQAVQSIFPISARFVEDQLQAVLSDIGANAIKIGMLHRTKIIQTVARCLRDFHVSNIVLDPVMISKNGHQLIEKSAIDALIGHLFPLTEILTPNLPEACALLKKKIATPLEMETAAQEISALGPPIVVLKGGHGMTNTSSDYFYSSLEKSGFWLTAPRIETHNTHGTGCTFSAAIAGYLGHGLPAKEAVSSAKTFITHAIQRSAHEKIGQGHGPVLVSY